MAEDHQGHRDSRLERLVEGVQDALLHTERENAARHIVLIDAIRQGKTDMNILGRLNALRSRLEKIAKALACLDART